MTSRQATDISSPHAVDQHNIAEPASACADCRCRDDSSDNIFDRTITDSDGFDIDEGDSVDANDIDDNSGTQMEPERRIVETTSSCDASNKRRTAPKLVALCALSFALLSFLVLVATNGRYLRCERARLLAVDRHDENATYDIDAVMIKDGEDSDIITEEDTEVTGSYEVPSNQIMTPTPPTSTDLTLRHYPGTPSRPGGSVPSRRLKPNNKKPGKKPSKDKPTNKPRTKKPKKKPKTRPPKDKPTNKPNVGKPVKPQPTNKPKTKKPKKKPKTRAPRVKPTPKPTVEKTKRPVNNEGGSANTDSNNKMEIVRNRQRTHKGGEDELSRKEEEAETDL